MAVILEQVFLAVWLICSAETLDECVDVAKQQYENCKVKDSLLLPDQRFWLSLNCNLGSDSAPAPEDSENE